MLKAANVDTVKFKSLLRQLKLYELITYLAVRILHPWNTPLLSLPWMRGRDAAHSWPESWIPKATSSSGFQCQHYGPSSQRWRQRPRARSSQAPVPLCCFLGPALSLPPLAGPAAAATFLTCFRPCPGVPRTGCAGRNAQTHGAEVWAAGPSLPHLAPSSASRGKVHPGIELQSTSLLTLQSRCWAPWLKGQSCPWPLIASMSSSIGWEQLLCRMERVLGPGEVSLEWQWFLSTGRER